MRVCAGNARSRGYAALMRRRPFIASPTARRVCRTAACAMLILAAATSLVRVAWFPGYTDRWHLTVEDGCLRVTWFDIPGTPPAPRSGGQSILNRQIDPGLRITSLAVSINKVGTPAGLQSETNVTVGVAMIGVLCAAALIVLTLPLRAVRDGCCASCGYDLRGQHRERPHAARPVCPECGASDVAGVQTSSRPVDH